MVTAPLFAERLAAGMTSVGLTVRKLADKSGVDKGTIAEWRQGGDRAVSVAAVRKVAAVMGTSAEYLLDLPLSADSRSPPAPRVSMAPVLDRVEQLLDELAVLVAAARRADVAS
jgi:transcriptional regulator with XRE-family HTH domain